MANRLLCCLRKWRRAWAKYSEGMYYMMNPIALWWLIMDADRRWREGDDGAPVAVALRGGYGGA